MRTISVRTIMLLSGGIVALLGLMGMGCAQNADEYNRNGPTLRVMTFNLEDIRSEDLERLDHPRLLAAAAKIQELRPDILLLNEIAFDAPDGQNAGRFVESFLSRPMSESLDPIRYSTFMAPSNTGVSSGYDLNRDGLIVTDLPIIPESGPGGTPGEQTPSGRAYGNDSWGFGMFEGHYAFALLVREGLTIKKEDVRTFQNYKWKDLTDPRPPVDPETGRSWYSDDVWTQFPLSSKSHWDVPVELKDGFVVHILASHPTPAAFDGPEMRNRLRNRAEIKFWGDYISGIPKQDDSGAESAFPIDAAFIVMGDLNADPDEGSAIDDPVGTFLLSNARINSSFTPIAVSADLPEFDTLDPDDTAAWGMRVDYVLPSIHFEITGGVVDRSLTPGFVRVSDHFPVYLDLRIW
ncbi:MAG: endonuclease/exonuclease/phosphatase family protein [Bacteroidetes bacterium]|nr:MAG: endonuclease/exonuclease/phosphatase family protein [Bacteroidota bacterium]